jgi:hypothetical protein
MANKCQGRANPDRVCDDDPLVGSKFLYFTITILTGWGHYSHGEWKGKTPHKEGRFGSNFMETVHISAD